MSISWAEKTQLCTNKLESHKPVTESEDFLALEQERNVLESELDILNKSYNEMKVDFSK